MGVAFGQHNDPCISNQFSACQPPQSALLDSCTTVVQYLQVLSLTPQKVPTTITQFLPSNLVNLVAKSNTILLDVSPFYLSPMLVIGKTACSKQPS